jgi:hypothetical protein
MRDKACFWNVLRVVCERPGLRYAEGFALTRFGWCHHAWVVDDEDQAVEVTSAEPGQRYIRVAFASAGEAIAAMENHRAPAARRLNSSAAMTTHGSHP